MLTLEVEKEIKSCVLCWLATVDAEGQPNVSPKEIFSFYDSKTLIIANIASPSSIKNINQNSLVCVSFVNIFKQKGYKVKGEAINLLSTHKNYEEFHSILYGLAGSKFPIQSIIKVNVKPVVPILAPSYSLYPETLESAQIESALKTYGVSFLE